LNNTDITKEYPLNSNEISDLLTRATSILNRYSGLFRASTYLPQVVGHNDYEYILTAVNESLINSRKEWAAFVKNRGME
jgi:hypothetical protein